VARFFGGYPGNPGTRIGKLGLYWQRGPGLETKLPEKGLQEGKVGPGPAVGVNIIIYGNLFGRAGEF